MNTQWKPSEIIVDRRVEDDPVTRSIIEKCQPVPIKFVSSANPRTIVEASDVFKSSGNRMLDKILAGKQVLFVAPATNNTVDVFTMPDERILCPHFERLKYAYNGCFYQCDWCYLKLTYRAVQPYITVYADHDAIVKNLEKRISRSTEPIIFNSGELADSLSLEHLTGAARKFIPWFGTSRNGFLFMLTKSDNVDEILDLPHNGHTIIAWSINNEMVSRKFEIGAPSFQRRLAAARKVQEAGYPLRLRLDPIVPYNGWRMGYAGTIKCIFEQVEPERITIGTLRFEEGFYKIRNNIFNTGPELPGYLDEMVPMFEPRKIEGRNKPMIGKYSFTEDKRTEIFDFVINEIRKYSDCKIALCKESAVVWQRLGLNSDACECACQL